MILHTEKSDLLLNAAGRTKSDEVTIVEGPYYLTDTAGNYLTDASGNRLIGYYSAVYVPFLLTAEKTDYLLRAD